jgi:tetratricopeptide (TPR) repeat protein
MGTIIWSLLTITSLAQTISNSRLVAEAEYRAGRLTSAEASLRTARAEAAQAGDNEDVAAIEIDLGDVCTVEERFGDAAQAYGRALALFRKIGNRELDMAGALTKLGTVYSLQDRQDYALNFLNQAARLRVLRTHANNKDVQLLKAEIANRKGIVFFRQGRLKKAMDFFQQATRTRTALGITGGLDHAQTLTNMGMIHLQRHRYTEAEQSFVQSLAIREPILGTSHPELTFTLVSLGEVYFQTGRYAESMAQYERSLAILRATTPPLNGRIARILQLVSENYLKQGNKMAAEHALADAVELARHTRLNDDVGVSDIFDSYANLLKQLRRPDEARQMHDEAERIRAAKALTIRVPANVIPYFSMP